MSSTVRWRSIWWMPLVRMGTPQVSSTSRRPRADRTSQQDGEMRATLTLPITTSVACQSQYPQPTIHPGIIPPPQDPETNCFCFFPFFPFFSFYPFTFSFFIYSFLPPPVLGHFWLGITLFTYVLILFILLHRFYPDIDLFPCSYMLTSVVRTYLT